tara:strand:+ start:11355 stop:11849 length:495 start_codon:yes stop_codon:yes gene_type:complete
MKHLLIILSLTAFVSCKENKPQEKEAPNETLEQSSNATHEQEQEKVPIVYDNAWKAEIMLDNGIKWDANIETTQGVLKMQELLKTVNTGSIEDYQKLAEKLNDIKNKIVKECSMTGASHDNLHVWLLPLIKKIDGLSKEESLENASIIKQSIVENIDMYFNYFK